MLFFCFSIDLETMPPCKGDFTANHTLNNCSKLKGITMKGLGVNSTRSSGIETDEGVTNSKEQLTIKQQL